MYYWRVAAENDAGRGPWSEVRPFLACNTYTVGVTASADPLVRDLLALRDGSLTYRLESATNVQIRVVDLSGRKLLATVAGPRQAGRHTERIAFGRARSGVVQFRAGGREYHATAHALGK